mmetsp:Transcript_7427/g.6661  ORF Transcript_7427/g.6661 Transcript_7427/m.6661 type:complete len:98 (-) Transcript_7427:52-345(-)
MLSSRLLVSKFNPISNKVRFVSSPSISSTLYRKVWKKSNALYITYVVIGCVVIEGIYGYATTWVWESSNRGKLYKDIDWSKFKSEDEEEEENEEEDE